MKKTITLSLAAIAAVSLMSFGVLHDTGETGGTESPADGNGIGAPSCWGCHSGAALNAAGGSLTMTASDNLLTSGYQLNHVYTFTLTLTKPGQLIFGFNFEALKNAGTADAGVLAPLNADAQAIPGVITTMINADLGNYGPSGSFTYTFQWTSPATNVGAIDFYSVGNAADGGGDKPGDFIYTKNVLNISTAVGVAEKAALDLNVSVFPNPVTESANVSYVLNSNSSVSAKLISINGQVVSTFFTNEQQTAGKQDKKLAIDPSLAKGNYFVVINVNGKNSYKKIVVE